MSAGWKRYPFTIAAGEPGHFTFPQADGMPRDLGVSTYYIDGFVGGDGGRRYAFNFVFAAMRVAGGRLHTNFLTFTLFDLAARVYGTCTEFDFPAPARLWRGRKLRAAPDHLDVSFAGTEGVSRWTNRRGDDGALLPFASQVVLHGRDQRGQPMHLALDVEAERPPIPLGGDLLRGRMMFLGAVETYAYFQAGLRMRGRLRWGATEEHVEGDVGWIDRQWAPRPFNAFNDWRSSRYRSEWRALQLSNGWDLCVFSQYLRPAHNRVVPWTGATAIGPTGEVAVATDVEVEIPAFVRDPGTVRPLLRLSRGPCYLPHTYRLRIPSMGLDVAATPYVDTPAQRMPIEYWTGPVALAGRMGSDRVEGLGFDERSQVWCRDFELAGVLAATVARLPDAVDVPTLCRHAREVEAVLLRGGRDEAAALLRSRIAPALDAVNGPEGASAHGVLRDLLTVIEQRTRAR